MPAKAALLTLVLLPGFQGKADLCQPLLRALPQSQPVRVLELPGGVIQSYEDLDPWLDGALARSKDYVLVAESFSSELAIRHAARHPKHLKGLITLGGFACLASPRWLHPLASLVPSFTSPIISNPRRNLIFGPLSTPLSTPLDDAVVVKCMSHYSTACLRGRLHAIMKGDQRPLLSQITVPRLAIHGQQDQMVPRPAWQALVDSGFEGKLVTGPHALAYSSPKEVAAALGQFLKSLDSSTKVRKSNIK